MRTMLYVLIAISGLLILMALYITATKPMGKKGGSRVHRRFLLFLYICLIIQLVITLFAVWIYFQPKSVPSSLDSGDSLQVSDPITETEPIPTEDPRLLFCPGANTDTDPDSFGVVWELAQGDAILESYERQDPIAFHFDEKYTSLPGISTFRGNNYRDSASWGTAYVENETMELVWSNSIGALNQWGGCGWTGQPLIVQWPDETKAIMSTLYEAKRNKDGLTEVICPALDGYIHFYDLEDGSRTRDPMYVNMSIKGTGALDPRGYPLLYVGAGVSNKTEAPRMFIISLIDGRILYENGHQDGFSLRNWSAFDSSPLIDADSDTLIWAGESGILYTIKLNSQFDPDLGTVSIAPDEPVKSRYTSTYSRDEGRKLGYEASPVIVDHYLYVSEMGGLFQCVDLNTMELIWVQDTLDDSSSSPLFEWGDNGEGYLYTAPSLRWTTQDHKGSISIYKLDAATGEILWGYDQECLRYEDIAGGVLSSPLVGREGTNIGGLILYSIARTPSAYQGVLLALDKDTGEKIWEISSGNYTWSSPVAFYTADGHAYIFLANASGVCRLVDGATGQVLDVLDLKQTVEASPVVFNNMLIIGTREGIYGIKIS